jgi:DNA (cytosine-5)-methyltransferase 1
MMPGQSDGPVFPRPLRVADLFAGCGGFAEGFRASGENRFRVVAAVEMDRAAAATFQANHAPDIFAQADIADVDSLPEAGEVDVITGGPPCQGFSGLGTRSIGDPRNGLWRDYVRFVRSMQPRVFVLENVTQFLSSQEFRQVQTAAGPGGELQDYTLSAKILNAADYGVPQNRKRAIVIGTRKDLGTPVGHPAPTRSGGTQSDRDEWVLFGAAEPLLPWETVEPVFEKSGEIRYDLTALLDTRSRHGIPGPYWTPELHFGRQPTETSLARYRAIPPGGNRHDLPSHLTTRAWTYHRTGSADVMGRLHLNRPSVTIRTEFFKPEKGRYLHPYLDRPITHYEAALIQGFPDTYQWYGTKTDIARQIGNAIPIGLARALADTIHSRLAQSVNSQTS